MADGGGKKASFADGGKHWRKNWIGAGIMPFIARLEDETLPLQLDRSTLDTQSLFTDYILESFSPSLIQQSLTFFLLFFSCCCRGPDAGIWKTHPTDWKVGLVTCFLLLNKMQCAVVLLVHFF